MCDIAVRCVAVRRALRRGAARCGPRMALADEVAALCLQRWKQLPRTGKPEPGREWTLLAAVLQVTRCANAGRSSRAQTPLTFSFCLSGGYDVSPPRSKRGDEKQPQLHQRPAGGSGGHVLQ